MSSGGSTRPAANGSSVRGAPVVRDAAARCRIGDGSVRVVGAEAERLVAATPDDEHRWVLLVHSLVLRHARRCTRRLRPGPRARRTTSASSPDRRCERPSRRSWTFPPTPDGRPDRVPSSAGPTSSRRRRPVATRWAGAVGWRDRDRHDSGAARAHRAAPSAGCSRGDGDVFAASRHCSRDAGRARGGSRCPARHLAAPCAAFPDAVRRSIAGGRRWCSWWTISTWLADLGRGARDRRRPRGGRARRRCERDRAASPTLTDGVSC